MVAFNIRHCETRFDVFQYWTKFPQGNANHLHGAVDQHVSFLIRFLRQKASEWGYNTIDVQRGPLCFCDERISMICTVRGTYGKRLTPVDMNRLPQVLQAIIDGLLQDTRNQFIALF